MNAGKTELIRRRIYTGNGVYFTAIEIRPRPQRRQVWLTLIDLGILCSVIAGGIWLLS